MGNFGNGFHPSCNSNLNLSLAMDSGFVSFCIKMFKNHHRVLDCLLIHSLNIFVSIPVEISRLTSLTIIIIIIISRILCDCLCFS